MKGWIKIGGKTREKRARGGRGMKEKEQRRERRYQLVAAGFCLHMKDETPFLLFPIEREQEERAASSLLRKIKWK